MHFFNWLFKRKRSAEQQRLYEYQKEINRQFSDAHKAKQLEEIAARYVQTKLVASNWRRKNESTKSAQEDIEVTYWRIVMQAEDMENKFKFLIKQLDEAKKILESLVKDNA